VLANDRVDIVNISGPNQVHTRQGVAAAKAGKHLLMEKPMCISMEENRALRDAVGEAGVKSVVSFVLRWNPLIENLKSLLAAKAIGQKAQELLASLPEDQRSFNLETVSPENWWLV
jgi:predicted dehydrogenase